MKFVQSQAEIEGNHDKKYLSCWQRSWLMDWLRLLFISFNWLYTVIVV